ncbi:hypothetical protein ACOJUR_15630 [Alicyclobacillus tolerans]|uniref:hypothetical protein n=1 Tax=Alicyclobacillus tolerans TaxID=90970 RepID=UPI003B7C97BE
MKQVFFSELYRLLHSWRRWGISLVVMCAFLYQGIYSYSSESITSSTSSFLAYLSALGIGSQAYWVGILPIIATWIAADSFAWDRKTSFVYFYLSRISRINYAIGKWCAIQLFTMCVFLVGLIFCFILSLLKFPIKLPDWRIVKGEYTIYQYHQPLSIINPFPVFFHNFFFQHPFMYLLLFSVIIILSACTWSSIGMLFSLISSNIYFTLAGSWMVYVIVTAVCAIPIVRLINFSPLVMSGPFLNSFSISPIWAVIYWLIPIGISLFIFMGTYKMRRDFFD